VTLIKSGRRWRLEIHRCWQHPDGGQDVEGVMWRCLGGGGGGALHAKEGNVEKGARWQCGVGGAEGRRHAERRWGRVPTRLVGDGWLAVAQARCSRVAHDRCRRTGGGH
jgi:hypothetical protein